MAQSPSHKFGQIIGDLLEETVYVPLKAIAEKHGLYLDYKHARPARGNRRKVRWRDHKENEHDLDYVIEAGGTEERIGTPKAFIESAWRRYTKHSRNKAQEIQGAILPLAETYSDHHPFLGAVLAGVFTEGSLQQLRSNGFSILYFSYESIVTAFRTAGIDASFDEDTPDTELQRKVDAYAALTERRRQQIAKALKTAHANDLASFSKSLEATLNRHVERVLILALHGDTYQVETIDDAIGYIENYQESRVVQAFRRYEIHVRYSNGDKVTGEFENKQTALYFLASIR